MSKCPTPEKHRHATKRAAITALQALERDKGIDLGLGVYRCPCAAWHVGHRRKESAFARRMRKAMSR